MGKCGSYIIQNIVFFKAPLLSFTVEVHIFYKKFRSGLSTQSSLAFDDFEYSKFLNSFLRLGYIIGL